jgi:hypothetical protein
MGANRQHRWKITCIGMLFWLLRRRTWRFQVGPFDVDASYYIRPCSAYRLDNPRTACRLQADEMLAREGRANNRSKQTSSLDATLDGCCWELQTEALFGSTKYSIRHAWKLTYLSRLSRSLVRLNARKGVQLCHSTVHCHAPCNVKKRLRRWQPQPKFFSFLYAPWQIEPLGV